MFTSDKLEDLFISEQAFIDVRSEGEFAAGHVPGALNLPILCNDERAAVGLCYKEQGQQAAIALGHRLVSGEVKAARLAAWQNYLRENPKAVIYCARGGMRSEITQAWLKESGFLVPRVQGGYKTLRRFLGEQIDRLITTQPCLVLGGRTGSGKTFLLEKFGRQGQKVIDLEHLAQHRGSAFGSIASAQPAQANFENSLALQLMRSTKSPGRLWLEDESRMIGRISLPGSVFQMIITAPLVVLEVSLEERVRVLIDHYILSDGRDADLLKSHYLSCLKRIRRRLGDQHTRRISELIEAAFAEYAQTGHVGIHQLWIEPLLTCYYDPLYDRHLTRQQHRIIARGTFEELTCLSIS